MVNIFQIRAARAWVGLSQEQLADEAGIARRTMIRLENSDQPRSERIMAKLRGALEKHGIEFLFEGRQGVGLRYRDPKK
ncbi:helix-turn-helix transcriptional regulator [Mesorhizobium sp.]|uniref:helix-turn-helix transcriptional regulator n=1 Tax=Mesorhizobium sp. TaxID=1871066 RepID=UPI0025D594C8|nr:helix-turn-helix transcriptional regulator [Mesorhizobium sp.]